MQPAAGGAEVIAVERDGERLARVRENLARTKLTARLVESDARDFKPDARASLVLLDAPCSATGTIRRHPDLPWIRSAADVTAATASAAELLEAAAEMTASGGLLVFAVCSLEPSEGEDQIARFLGAHPEFSRVPVTAGELFGHGEWITPEGELRTLPFQLEGGMDGFYAARLRKIPIAFQAHTRWRDRFFLYRRRAPSRVRSPPPSPSLARASRLSNSLK